jgi:AraC-like DNA-binding protein
LPLQIIAIGNPVTFCLFAAAVFDDDFKPSRVHALAWLAVVALGVFCLWSANPLARYVLSAAALVFNAIGVWYVLAERSSDLVEERRRLRAALIVVVAIYSVIIITTEIVLAGPATPALSLANAIGLLVVTMVFVFVLFSVNREGVLISFRPHAPPALVAASPQTNVDLEELGEDTRLLAALRRLMEHDKVYRGEALSIGDLANKLSISEHRLRHLINKRLGYRNFNVFLNSYRLDEVMSALRDHAQQSVPILTIALDAGFQSLGPFNRAFKLKTGMTPSEFRRTQLSEAIA